jgi:hypothetical protein
MTSGGRSWPLLVMPLIRIGTETEQIHFCRFLADWLGILFDIKLFIHDNFNIHYFQTLSETSFSI